jgi:hypothetical protein
MFSSSSEEESEPTSTGTSPPMNDDASPNPSNSRGRWHSPIRRAKDSFTQGLQWILGSLDDVSTPTDAGSELRQRQNSFLRSVRTQYVQEKVLQFHIVSWNVASASPPEEGVDQLFSFGEGDPVPDVVVIGLQEVEFGGTALMLETTDASVAWMEAATDSLQRLGKPVGKRFKKVAMTQLVGITIMLIARVEHCPYVKNLRMSLSRTGAMAVVGNKGAIGLRATIYGKRFLFICAHFAAHKGNVLRRNGNFQDALTQLKFDLTEFYDDEMSEVESNVAAESRGTRCEGSGLLQRVFGRKEQGVQASKNAMTLLSRHDYAFFFGDLNYRLSGVDPSLFSNGRVPTYAEIADHDELHCEMRAGNTFEGFTEPGVNFPPSYKYQRGTGKLDLEKREPAWTDRILFRVQQELDGSTLDVKQTEAGKTDSSILPISYTSPANYTLSDHRPVVGRFEIRVHAVDVSKAVQLLTSASLWEEPRTVLH